MLKISEFWNNRRLNILNILAKYKKKNKLNLIQMANKAKVTPSTLHKHLNNKRSIRSNIILKYIKAFDIPAHELLKVRAKEGEREK